MIDKQHGKYILVCDNCNCGNDNEYGTYEDAVKAKDDSGWSVSRVQSQWMDLCPKCGG